MGLAYVGASLESHGHDVQILDAYALRWSWNRFTETIKSIRPDVLGLKAMTPTADSAAKTTQAARPYASHIVLGGPHPTAMGQEAVSYTHLTLPTICSV